jgi:hypothetical protein
MVSEDGTTSSKMMNLSNLRLSQEGSLSIDEFASSENTLQAFPNPMTTKTTLTFSLTQTETLQFVVYDQLGKQVYNKTYNAIAGRNSITFNRNDLSTGLYFCKIISNQYNINPLKLIIN